MSFSDPREDSLRMDMGTVIAELLRRAVRIGLVTALLVAATYAVLLTVPRLYESSASLLVEQRDNAITRIGDGQGGAPSGVTAEALMSSQIELIKSRDLLLEVAETLALEDVPEFAEPGFSPVAALMTLLGRGADPRTIEQRVLENLGNAMTVIRERDSAVISVFVRSRDPELAAQIANAVAEAHVRRRAAQSVSDTAGATVWLEGEIAKLRTRVTEAEAAVAAYKVDKDLFVGGASTPVADQQLSTISTQVAEAQQRKNTALSRAELIRGLIASGQSLDGVTDVRESVVIQRLVETKANLQGELALRSSTLLPNHPTIKSLVAQIEELEAQIASEARRVADSLDAEATVEAALEQRLRDDLTRAKLTASDATRDGVTLDSLEREAKAQRDLLENYLGRYADAVSRSDAGSALPDVRIVSQAAAATEPASPKVALTLGAVAFVALALQIGLVVFGELLSGRALVERRIEADEAPAAAVAAEVEEIDHDAELAAIAAEVAAVSPQGPPRPRDELEALAAALADRQVRTLLLMGLDAAEDCAPVLETLARQARKAGLSLATVDAGSGLTGPRAGLTDLAAGSVDFGQAVHRLDVDTAEVPWGREAALDRRSDRPLTLIDALADLYHVVLIDTGRIGVASSLPMFAGAAARVVLVTDGPASPSAVTAARRDVAALGFELGHVVMVPRRRADVA
jgi:succinoglycan biosynthesis transport protein ExoP